MTKDGARIDILLNAATRRGPDGTVIGVIGVGQDAGISGPRALAINSDLDVRCLVPHVRLMLTEESAVLVGRYGEVTSGYISMLWQFSNPAIGDDVSMTCQ